MAAKMTVQQALQSISRQHFVELNQHTRVQGHSIPPQNRVEQILNSLHLKPSDRVLQIGTGAGYLTALISRMVDQIITIEQSQILADAAQKRFAKLKLENICLLHGDGSQGAADKGPFEIILVASPKVTERQLLLSQLSAKGRLIAVEEDEYLTPILVEYQTGASGNTRRTELGPLEQNFDTGAIMLDLGVLNETLLQQARQRARKENKPLIEVLRKLVDIEEIDLYRALATQSEMAFKDLEDLIPVADPGFFGSFSRSFLDTLHLIPLSKTDKTMLVATFDPEADTTNLQPLYSNLKINKVLVTPTDFRRLWSMLEICLQGELKQLKSFKQEQKNSEQDLLNKQKSEVEAHLIALLDALLLDAVSERASDIHLEQYNQRVRIRFRIDGELRDISHYQLSPQEARGLVNVIKIRAELNIAEKRLPQGGRSHMQVGHVSYDLRVQVQPSLHGEDVVIRLLPQNEQLIGIEELGLSPRIAKSYQRLLDNPAGLILVVGPTGSGKSTTLYAGLQLLANDGRRKVITAEDPVEYSINNIQQTQIRPEIDFHFSDAMRSFVRQDPDVILVGEIRDHETAEEALRASQTGHVVLSTLHCNDATDALQRLYDLHVHPNSIASELLAVIAQRLAKRICPQCRQQVEPDPAIIAELFPLGVPDNFKCFEGMGCNHCDQRGTKGRIGVVEYMQVNTDIRNAISQQQPILELRETALDSGLLTMRDSALDHVIQGVIPLSELPRILPAERMAPEQRGHFGRQVK
ncbi:MAG: hypothetical protein AseanaTS_28540 [Candidatus Pelagadaptatus aseana]|uniref:ATPase, T2SS/T4P/T4SS family n=1 Tax=Candidatus Pelagadaptatus aseana TaxID=3120508 RepID=UPI0039B21386